MLLGGLLSVSWQSAEPWVCFTVGVTCFLVVCFVLVVWCAVVICVHIGLILDWSDVSPRHVLPWWVVTWPAVSLPDSVIVVALPWTSVLRGVSAMVSSADRVAEQAVITRLLISSGAWTC